MREAVFMLKTQLYFLWNWYYFCSMWLERTSRQKQKLTVTTAKWTLCPSYYRVSACDWFTQNYYPLCIRKWKQEGFLVVFSLWLLLMVLIWRAGARVHGVNRQFVMEERGFLLAFNIQCSDTIRKSQLHCQISWKQFCYRK